MFPVFARQEIFPSHAPLGITPLAQAQLLASLLEGRVAHQVSECAREGSLDLDLSELKLTALPAALAHLPYLHCLDVNRNELQMGALLESPLLHAGALPELRSLSANDNALVGALPEGLGSLAPCLEELSLAGNLITALPPAAGALGRLEWVSLASNRIRELPGEVVGAWGCLRYLDLRNNLLTALPPELARCATLEELHVSGNALTALPEAWAAPSRLAVLSAAGNALVELPVGLDAATELETVDFSGNKLTVLPGEVVQAWVHLRELYISANALGFLPEQLGQLQELEVLAAAGNQLTALPPQMGNCTALRELYLGGNKALSALPEGSEKWTELQTLNLRLCKFKTLPLCVYAV